MAGEIERNAAGLRVALCFSDINPNPDKPEIGNIKIENLKVKLRRLYNAMISQKNWIAFHFTFSFFILIFDIVP